MSDAQPRVLVFIVSYFAEQHIASVLQRLPAHLKNNPKIHVLCIDDASSDESVKVAMDWARRSDWTNITVLRNPINQGYGGNQKLGYRLAVDSGYDLVILLHGDGQYAPELVPEFIRIWQESKADVILGSRMQKLSDARQGGMPLYKLVGNRVLTCIQNALTGRSLSEYHTGYRAYSTKFLRSIPFEINTNDFHFDTEILLQAFFCRAAVVEFPIPTHYGEEICRVNGMRYARDVLISTLQYFCHCLGLFCSLKYRGLQSANDYASKLSQKYSAQARALALIDQMKPSTLIDIGCGPGFVAGECIKKGIEVAAVDRAPPSQCPDLKEFYQLDLDRQDIPIDVFDRDVVLLLDVIEQLGEPEAFLLQLRNNSSSERIGSESSRLILTTPNVAFITIRLNLLLGRFNYAERGILNIAHKRLFTRKSLLQLLRDCNFVVEKMIPIGAPFELVMPGELGHFLSKISNVLAQLIPDLFAFQFLVVARPKPGVKQLLSTSERHLLNEPGLVNALNGSRCESLLG